MGRFSFDRIELLNGFSVIPVLIGLFALSEAFNQIENLFDEKSIDTSKIKIDKNYLSLKELKKVFPTMLKSGIIGTFIGSIPGAGADIAAFVCYNEAKRSSKTPEEYGKGSLEGISAPEAGNNGVTGGALVPLLTLGVPGDAVAAVLLGALIMQGLTPGPLLFEQNPEIVYGLFSSMILGNIILLVVGLFGIRFFSKIVEIPKAILIPSIIVLSTVGSFSMNNSMFDVGITFFFGVLGYILSKLKVPNSPIVLAIILGPMIEENFRKSILMYEGSLSFLYTRPITIVFLILTLISIISVFRKDKKKIN